MEPEEVSNGLHGLACLRAIGLLLRRDDPTLYVWAGELPRSKTGFAGSWPTLQEWLDERVGHTIAVCMAVLTETGEDFSPAHEFVAKSQASGRVDLRDTFGETVGDYAGRKASFVALDLTERGLAR